MSSGNVQEGEVVEAILVCGVCEADLSSESSRCLRCGSMAAGSGLNPFAAPIATRAPENIERETDFNSTLVSVLLTLGLIGVLIAVGFASPGHAIGLALLTLPPWIRTTLVVFKRSKSGLQTSSLGQASLFLGSALVTWLILFVSIVSCCLTFCATCWVVLLAGPNGKNQDALIYVLWGSIGVTFFLVLLAFSPWIRSRWKKHSTRES